MQNRTGCKTIIQLIALFFISSATSCSAPTSAQPSEPSSLQITPSVSQLSSNRLIPTTTELGIFPDSDHTPIIPTVTQYCPHEREVTFAELDISPSTMLLLNRFENGYPYDLWILTKGDPHPTIFPNFPTTYLSPLDFAISPNQQWFAYILINDEDKRNLWISSMDGTRQEQILSNFDGYPRWVDDELIEVWEIIEPRQCPQYVLGINPFTHEIEDAPKKPFTDKPHCFFSDLMSPDRTMYVHRDSQLTLYDYSNETQIRIFPWLPDDWDKGEAGYVSRFFWTENGFTIIFPKGTLIEYSINLPLASAIEEKNPLNVVQLSSEILGNNIPWASPIHGLVAIDLIVTEDIENRHLHPSQLFIYDLLSNELRDYCLDRSVSTHVSGVSSSEIISSLDGKYLAWTIYDTNGVQPLETLVLEIITGRISRIEGFQSLGWGESPN